MLLISFKASKILMHLKQIRYSCKYLLVNYLINITIKHEGQFAIRLPNYPHPNSY